MLDEFITSVESLDSEPETGSQPPYGSPEWSDYVLSLLTEKERVDGNPTVPGLRRLARQLLGPTLYSGPTKWLDEDGRSSVQYQVKLWMDKEPDNEPYEAVFEGVANCVPQNTDATYIRWALATAETRAEGRALKKALLIDKPAAEELAKEPVDTGLISPEEVDFIRLVLIRAGVDIEKYLKAGTTPYDRLEDLPKKVVETVKRQASLWQNDPSKIPVDLRRRDD